MNFNSIDILSEEEILEEYMNINENNSDNLMSATIWNVRCSNGYVGVVVDKLERDVVNPIGVYSNGYAPYLACGDGIYGYCFTMGNFNTNEKGSIWHVQCNNGYTGIAYDPNDRCGGVGFYIYGCGVAQGKACGSGRCGIATCLFVN